MLRIKQFTFNPFAVSTYVVYDTDTRQAMVIDPGMSSTAEHAAFDSFIANERLTVTQVVNTHLHLDH
ncbi:MAG: MBL fold metallo-hydrolase, partial [Muribaculaceae bacterium]|nr:MBL fold metallo-hydrolase [Muribaculaceae bacterium]